MMRFLVFILTLAPTMALGADASTGLSKRMICYVYSTLDGTVGMLIGFVVALYGLWVIIKGSTGFGIFTILAGAAITMLPAIVVGGLSGLQGVVQDSGMSDRNRGNSSSIWEDFSIIRQNKNNCEAIAVDMSDYIQQPRQTGQGSGYGVGGDGGITPIIFPPGTAGACGAENAGANGSCTVNGGRITSEFGMRRHPVTGEYKMHNGIDIAAATGTAVRSYADGEVTRVENQPNGYGNVVYVRHADGSETRYAHLNSFSSGLSVGQRVSAGDTLGGVGSTGRSTGAHLHFEYRDSGGTPRNPRGLPGFGS